MPLFLSIIAALTLAVPAFAQGPYFDAEADVDGETISPSALDCYGTSSLNLGDTAYVDCTNNRVGIGMASPVSGLDVASTATIRGRILGATSSLDADIATARNPRLAIVSDPATIGDAAAFTDYGADPNGATVGFFKTRSASPSSDGNTVVANGDTIMSLLSWGADGDNYSVGASIKTQVDGTPGDGDMPARIVFSTSGDGEAVERERLRIDSGGQITSGDPTTKSTMTSTGHGQFWELYTGNAGSPGCLMMRDSDDAGWSECSVLNGTFSCTTDADGVCDGS